MASDPTGADAIKVVQHIVELEAKIERLEADKEEHRAWKERHLDTVLMAQNCGKQEGMEAAVKDVRSCPWIQGPVIAEWLRRKIAAAKQLAGEAGSRELLAPATPSPGSASPASHQELCERARLEQDDADYPTPTCCDGGDAEETT